MYHEGRASKELLSLAKGPDNRVKRYTGCNANGFRFHTQDRERKRKTQNSGVVVEGEHDGRVIDFYGVIIEVIELEYLLGQNRVMLFKCDWWDVKDNTSIQIDKDWNITSVNVSRTWYKDQPFVLASQAKQVFYIEDLKLGKHWRVVERTQPRGSFDVPEQFEEQLISGEEPYQEHVPDEVFESMEIDEMPSLERDDMIPLGCTDVDNILHDQPMENVDEEDNNFINDSDIEEDSCSDDIDKDDTFSNDECESD